MTRQNCSKTCSPSPPSLSQAITASARRAIAASEEKKLRERQKRRDKAEEKARAQGKEPPTKKVKKEAKWTFTRARRIRIYPTASQKPLLKAAFEACRHVYNKTVEAINSLACKPNRKDMRAVAVNKEVWDKVEKDKAWEVVDYELRDGAMLDAFKAVQSTRESMVARGEDNKRWKFKGRKKKDRTESIAVRARRLNGSVSPWYLDLFGRSGARHFKDGKPIMACSKKKRLPDEFESDVRIWHHKVLDEYMLIIPEEAPAVDVAAPDTQGRRADATAMEVDSSVSARKRGAVSIDPGVRTFATCYDPDGLVCKWGCSGSDGSPSANSKLWRIANQANSIRARMQNPMLRTNKVGRGKRHRRRRHMRRAAARLELRIRNLVAELHHKLALWLCKNYETVLLPTFHVAQMAKKRDRQGRRRKIGRRTVKEMYSLGHCRFRQYLKYLAERYSTLVCECDEMYTTQTCGACGRLNYVGTSETYRCRLCGAVFDRDENAARNIMLKFVQDNGVDLTGVLMPQPQVAGPGQGQLRPPTELPL